MSSDIQNVVVLGSTGSVGINTLDVISGHPDRFRVYGLSAHRNVDLMIDQCQRFRPEKVVMVDPESADLLADKIRDLGLDITVSSGETALSDLSAGAADTIVCGIVGAAGLFSTIAAVEAGKKVLVANKEPLVMMGQHIMRLVEQNGACLLPLDSEHNAIFQCLPQQFISERNGNAAITPEQGIRKVLLTASGGPFRTLALDALHEVTPEQACAHPNWTMGRKISVDSATMMNKGLELIEACVIFDIEVDQVDIVIHPQSIIHSMVEYIDGSVIAQMGSPDMRVPISNALGWPDRIESGASSLDFTEISRFDFEQPDFERFPALGLAESAAKAGGTMPAILNAANEMAVEAFLKGEITFDNIPRVVEKSMSESSYNKTVDLKSVLDADRESRQISRDWIKSWRI